MCIFICDLFSSLRMYILNTHIITDSEFQKKDEKTNIVWFNKNI